MSPRSNPGMGPASAGSGASAPAWQAEPPAPPNCKRGLRYYITDRRQAGGRQPLLDCIRRNLTEGIDYLQIREKDLPGRDFLTLVEEALTLAQATTTKVVVNGRLDIALAAGAHGVHLPSDSIHPATLRRITPPGFVIGVSCHAGDDLDIPGADYILYAPIFQPRSKASTTPAIGLEGLAHASRSTKLPLLALGGITWENAASCIEAGAAGIAGITLFQEAATPTED